MIVADFNLVVLQIDNHTDLLGMLADASTIVVKWNAGGTHARGSAITGSILAGGIDGAKIKKKPACLNHPKK